MAHPANLNTQNQTCGRTGCFNQTCTFHLNTHLVPHFDPFSKITLQEWIKICTFPYPKGSQPNSNDIKVGIGHWTKNWSRGEVKQIYYETEEITKSLKIQIIWLEHIYYRLKSRRFKYLIWLIWVIKYWW